VTDGVLSGHSVWSAANRRRFEVWSWSPSSDDAGARYPLLVLLHGVYDAGGYGWWHKGGAADTLNHLHLPVVVLMATDTGAEQGSGYCDWADGTTKAETHIIDELLPWAAENLPVGGERHIGGLSMGGYGAFTLALRHPGLFESASATSAFFDPNRLFNFVDRADVRMWGSDAARDEHDPRLLVRDQARRDGLRLALDCGTEDHLLDQNRAMHRLLDELGVKHGYAEHPGGHDWDYWGARVEDHVRFALDCGGPLQP
jgi:putative tributyrin esterase